MGNFRHFKGELIKNLIGRKIIHVDYNDEDSEEDIVEIFYIVLDDETKLTFETKTWWEPCGVEMHIEQKEENEQE